MNPKSRTSEGLELEEVEARDLTTAIGGGGGGQNKKMVVELVNGVAHYTL